MKLFTFTLATVIITGVSAFAMPQWDGTYTCTDMKDNSKTTATLTTRDNKLFIDGVGTTTVTGFPCENNSNSETKSGMTLTSTAKCTDMQLTNVSQQQQASTDTNLSTEITVTKNSDTQVTVFLSFAGKTGGSNVGMKVNLDCRR